MAKAKANALSKPVPSSSTTTTKKKSATAPKKDTLIDSHVSSSQSELAFKALIAHATKHAEKLAEKDLLADGGNGSDNVWLQVAVKTLYPEKKLKPHTIPLAHPLVDPRETPVCLITKDPQREYKDLLASHNINFISRVVGIEKLKGKFKPFEARRMLLAENGLFLADERVVPLLPRLLGKRFFSAKKQPIPVCLTRKDLKGELERAISATYMHQNQGSCTSIKIGKVSHTPIQLAQNLQTALPHIIRAIRGPHTSRGNATKPHQGAASDPSAVVQTLLKNDANAKKASEANEEDTPDPWDNIQSLSVKTSKSMALPIWSCNLEDGGRWAGMPEVMSSSDEEELDEEGSASEEAEVTEVPKKVGKGTKRAAEESEGEKPAKKAKATEAKALEAPTPNLPKKSKKSKLDADPTPVAKSLSALKIAPIQLAVASGSEADIESAVVDGGIVPEAVKMRKEKKSKKAGKNAEDSTGEVAKEKEKKSVEKKAAEEDAAMEIESETPAPVSSKKSKKDKKKITEVELEPTPASSLVVEEIDVGSKKEKKKGKKDKEIPSTATPTVLSPEPTSKATKGLTREEMKQKKEKSVVGEKKKDKILKASGSLANGEGRKGKRGAIGGK